MASARDHAHLLDTIEHLTSHLELDNELAHIQQKKSALDERISALKQHKVEAAVQQVRLANTHSEPCTVPLLTMRPSMPPLYGTFSRSLSI